MSSSSIGSLVVSAIYGLLLTVSLPIDGVLDRANYLYALQSANSIAALFIKLNQLTFSSLLSSELLWNLMNVIGSEIFFSETLLRIYIFFSASSAAFLIARVYGKSGIFVLAILVTPAFLKNYIIHLRQGIAISIALNFFLVKSAKRGLLVILIASLVHASFSFFLPALVLDFILKKFDFYVRKSVLFLSGVILALILVVFSNMVNLAMFSQKIGQYDGSEIHYSGVGYLANIALVIPVLLIRKRQVFFAPIYFLFGFYLISFFYLPYAARIWESLLVFVCLISLKYSPYKLVTMSVIFVSSIFYYLKNFGEPIFGWGGV